MSSYGPVQFKRPVLHSRNEAAQFCSSLVNSRTAEVVGIANGRVTFRLEDGKTLELGKNEPQLRHLDHAWASKGGMDLGL